MPRINQTIIIKGEVLSHNETIPLYPVTKINTPGRLIELLEKAKGFNLRAFEILVRL